MFAFYVPTELSAVSKVNIPNPFSAIPTDLSAHSLASVNFTLLPRIVVRELMIATREEWEE